ncbi:MAG: NAD(+)/NADH kinase [Bacteroidales bacterium]|nr:NAD(+)/NADH kinase [Bacteroidales bacterium]
MKNDALRTDARVVALLSRLEEAGISLFEARSTSDLCHDCEMLLSIGGDGTFLDATRIAAGKGIAVFGVNLGRMGFLSGSGVEDVVSLLLSGRYRIEERAMLEVKLEDAAGARFEPDSSFWRFALNEVSVLRGGGAMLGVDVTVGGEKLPTYWADGLLVSTSTGSTAYSLSVGGPICLPDTDILIVAPVSPHNLNVRPLIVPLHTEIGITFQARSSDVLFSMDNRVYSIPATTRLRLGAAPVRARRVNAGRTDFIGALKSRLLWGSDIRNSGEQR